MRMTVVVVMVVIVSFVLMVFAMSVCGVVVSFVIRMPMRALRMITMIVALAVSMVVSMIVRVPVMFIEDLLRERVVLYKRLVMPMLVAAAIRARLRLERSARVLHMR